MKVNQRTSKVLSCSKRLERFEKGEGGRGTQAEAVLFRAVLGAGHSLGGCHGELAEGTPALQGEGDQPYTRVIAPGAMLSLALHIPSYPQQPHTTGPSFHMEKVRL